MNKIARFESKEQRTLRAISATRMIKFGTTVPYSFGIVGFHEVGFAHIPAVGFNAITHSPYDITAVARQHILEAVVAVGENNELNVGAVDLTVHVGVKSRRRKFTDENLSSDSCGKSKIGHQVAYHLEITMRSEVAAFRKAFARVYL